MSPITRDGGSLSSNFCISDKCHEALTSSNLVEKASIELNGDFRDAYGVRLFVAVFVEALDDAAAGAGAALEAVADHASSAAGVPFWDYLRLRFGCRR